MEKYTITRIGERAARIDDNDRGFSQYAIRYDDGRVAFDFPERLPWRIKDQVGRVLRDDS